MSTSPSPRTPKQPGTATDASGDALAPAPMGESLRFLFSTPNGPTRGRMLRLAVALAVTLTGLVGTSVVVGWLVDLLAGRPQPLPGDEHTATTLAIATLVVLALAEQIARARARYHLDVTFKIAGVELRNACMSATLAAPIPRIMELGTGNIMTRLTKDIDDFVRSMNQMAFRVIIAVLMFPASLVVLAGMSLWLLVPFIVLTLLLAVPIARRTSLLPKAANIAASREGDRNNILLDTIRSVPTIRALGLVSWAQRRADDSSWKAVRARLFVAPVFASLVGLSYVFYGGFLISTLGVAAWLAYRGDISVGTATAAAMVVARMEVPIFNVVMMLGQIQEAFNSLGRAVALAHIARGAVMAPGPELNEAPKVTLDHLSFAYPGGAKIIDDVSVTLAAGSTTAIVGASGAGKSTLAALIAGLNRPNSGRVLIGDTDTATVADSWTARQVTLMSQEVHLFHGTLREDLRMAAPDASDEQFLTALTQVGLGPGSINWARFFPQGLDTPVGSGADPLPAAIAQQISLARVMLVNPPVVIMDEATSEAGSDYARTLETAARAATEARTAIVIAHRLDQAAGADRILLMAHGRIVEDGTHEELLAANGTYASVYRAWASATESTHTTVDTPDTAAQNTPDTSPGDGDASGHDAGL